MSTSAGRMLLALTSLVAAAGLVSCTASATTTVSSSSISKATIEQGASKQISDRFGGGSYKVTCPHDLAAEKGASMTCIVTFPDGEKFTGTAKVTSVSGGKAHWTYTASAEATNTP
jgi:hypothetical protein